MVERLGDSEGEAHLVEAGREQALVAALVERETSAHRPRAWTDRCDHVLCSGHLRYAFRIDETRYLDPGHARALYGRANMRATRGDIAGSIADYTAALRINPGYVEALNNRGLAKRRAGDEAGARADFMRALAVAPPGWPGREVIQRNLGQ